MRQGLSVTLPPHTCQHPTHTVDLPEARINFDPVIESNIVGHESVLRHGRISSARTFLRFASFDGLEVRSHAGGGGAILLEGSDYQVSPLGRMWAPKVARDRHRVTMSYRGFSQRYDIVYVDLRSETFRVAKGTDRPLDPENWFPELPAGSVPAYHAYVTRDGVDLIPVLDFHHFERYGEEAKWQRLMDSNRAALQPFLDRCESAAHGAEPPRIVLYGDSTQSIGGSSRFDDNIVPNGPGKDTVHYFSERAPRDTISRLRTYTAESTPDFQDYATGSTNHIKIGAAWALKEALERTFSIRIRIENRAWSGTQSGAYMVLNGNVHYSDPGGWSNAEDDVRCGALWPARLHPMLNSLQPGDLVIWGMGTNELGRDFTYANTLEWIQAVQAKRAVALVNGCRFPSRDCDTGAGVAETNDQLHRAAAETESAFNPTHWVESPGNEGACGLSPNSFGNDNYHHPSIAQLLSEGLLMAKACGVGNPEDYLPHRLKSLWR